MDSRISKFEFGTSSAIDARTEITEKMKGLISRANIVDNVINRLVEVQRKMAILRITQQDISDYMETSQSSVSRVLTLNQKEVNKWGNDDNLFEDMALSKMKRIEKIENVVKELTLQYAAKI